MPRLIWLCAFALVFPAVWIAPARSHADFEDFRALWVSRFEYNGSASVQSVMANAASLGITDVLFQVRGKADAYYNSNLEPRAERLSGSWDPLQTAIDAAHGHGMKIHAWINTTPIWRDTAAPDDPNHIFFNTDPSYRVANINGVLQDPVALGSEYASVNPIIPEVHSHIGDVVNEIAINYNVDGVHLDFIRWLGGLSFDTLPHDAQSHQLFNNATGLDGLNSNNASAYRGFITDRITDLVGSIKTTVDAAEVTANRAIDLSAAVWRDPDVALNERLQDYRTWLESDLLDVAMPMIYLSESNDNLFMPNLLNTLNITSNTKVAPGLGVYLHTTGSGGVNLTIDQLDRLNDNGADGATFFSYGSFFSSGQLGEDRQDAVIEYYASLNGGGGGEDILSVTDFEADEGYFGWSPLFSGSNSGINSATADRVTTDAQNGIGSQLIHIDGSESGWLLRHVSGIGSPGDAAAASGNIPIDSTGFIGFWLKTDSPGVQVQLALDDPGTADRGFAQPVIADGEWHLYQWNLEDDGQWEGWVMG